MKQWFTKVIEKYAHFVSTKPLVILIAVLFITVLAINFAGNVKTTSMNNRDSLPDNVEVIQAFNIMQDSFSSSDQLMIAVLVEPENIHMKEIRDLRNPTALQYIDILSEASLHLEDVVSVQSASFLIKKDNNNILPKTLRDSIKLANNNVFMDQYISKDKTMALIKLNLADNYNDEEIIADVQEIINQIPNPLGIIAKPAGEIATGPVMNEQLGPDMAKTSQFSLIGIIFIMFLLFRSFKYSLTPLGVIAVGIIWAFGYLGLTGTNLNSATSGVISMIMGIGIDFGIQIVTRYKFELIEQKGNFEEAMKTTMNNVFIPMATTTLAALIGFKAMGMGQLTIMAEFGQIMSYGITACFFAAITVVPSILMLSEQIKKRNIKRKKRKLKRFDKIIKETFTMIGGLIS